MRPYERLLWLRSLHPGWGPRVQRDVGRRREARGYDKQWLGGDDEVLRVGPWAAVQSAGRQLSGRDDLDLPKIILAAFSCGAGSCAACHQESTVCDNQCCVSPESGQTLTDARQRRQVRVLLVDLGGTRLKSAWTDGDRLHDCMLQPSPTSMVELRRVVGGLLATSTASAWAVALPGLS